MPHACAHTSKTTVGKAKPRAINRERATVQNCVAGLQAAAAAWFRKLRLSLTAQLQAAVASSTKAADEEIKRKVRRILEDLEFEDEEGLIEEFRAHLEAMHKDGAQQGVAQIAALAGAAAIGALLIPGRDDGGHIGRLSVDAFDLVNEHAVAYARDRSAEMVGMKWVDGDLVQNPNARWRIDDGTRELLRSDVTTALQEGWSNDQLADALAESYAFSERRAEVIARTETADADVEGTLAGYRALGVTKKRWLTAPDCCDDCQTLDEQEVGIDEDFTAPDGTRISGPTLHPQCRCYVLPVLDDDDPPAKGMNLKDSDMTKLFAAIEKAEKQDDGTIKVFGYASAEVVDSDGETVTADAMRKARDGYMAFANVREMHDPKKAAGVAIEYDVQEDGRTWFGALVVDPVAVLKVETGVYKGFSIGARVPPGGREGKVIKSIDLREVSLVDRPANPEAVFLLAKAEAGPEEEGSEGGETDLAKALSELRDLREALGAKEGESLVERVAQMRIGLEKAGKRFSTKTKAALKAAHEACKAADKALADLGYDAEDAADEEGGEAGEKAATVDDLRKAVGCPDDQEPAAWVEKMRGELQALRDATPAAETVAELAKAAGFELAEPTLHDLTKAAITELVTLRKAHADLKASPAAPKGVLRSMVVDKAADRGDETKEPEPVVKADGTVDDAATLVKAAQARPIRIVA